MLASILLMASIVKDVRIVYPQLKDRCLLDDYVDFEKQNIRKQQQACIQRIHNTIAFRTPGWGKYFQAFTNLESKNIATLENDLIILLDPEINSLDELGYEAEDIRDARKRMLKSNDEDIKSIYEMLLFSAMLELLEINVSRYPLSLIHICCWMYRHHPYASMKSQPYLPQDTMQELTTYRSS